MESVADDEALARNLVQSELFAVLAAAQFNDRHHPFELAFELDITLQENAVGQKGFPVRAEPQIDVRVHHSILVFPH